MSIRALLCGPMSGDPAVDGPIFKHYEDKLRADGIIIFNPVEIIKNGWKNQGEATAKMRHSAMVVGDSGWRWYVEIWFIMDTLTFCDAVFLMPQWENAANSLIVAFAAQALGIKLLYRKDGQPRRRKINLICEFDSDNDMPKVLDFSNPAGAGKEIPLEEYEELKRIVAEEKAMAAGNDGEEPFEAADDDIATVEELDERIADTLSRAVKSRTDRTGPWLEMQFPNDPSADLSKKKGGRHGRKG